MVACPTTSVPSALGYLLMGYEEEHKTGEVNEISSSSVEI